MPKNYASWTDATWDELFSKVRSKAPVSLSDQEIRDAAWSYMHNGADGGGNALGLLGTHIALCVDEVHAAH